MRIKCAIRKPSTQRAALAPILWLNWIYGVGVIEIAGVPRFVCSIIYKCILITIYFTSLYGSGFDFQSWLEYQEAGYTLTLWVNIIVAIISIILGTVNAKCLRNIIARWEKIDNTLEVFGVKKDYGKTLQYTIRDISILVGIFTFYWTADAIELLNEFGFAITLYVSVIVYSPIILNSVVLLTFVIFIRVLGEKLRNLNGVMSDMIQLANDVDIKCRKAYKIRKFTVSMDYSSRKFLVQNFLEASKHIHLEIIKISRQLNRAYCYQLLLELAVEFSFIMCALYNIYFEIMKSRTLSAIIRNRPFYLLSAWCFTHSFKIIIVNNICSDLSQQARITSRLLREVGSSYFDDYIRDEVKTKHYTYVY